MEQAGKCILCAPIQRQMGGPGAGPTPSPARKPRTQESAESSLVKKMGNWRGVQMQGETYPSAISGSLSWEDRASLHTAKPWVWEWTDEPETSRKSHKETTDGLGYINIVEISRKLPSRRVKMYEG